MPETEVIEPVVEETVEPVRQTPVKYRTLDDVEAAFSRGDILDAERIDLRQDIRLAQQAAESRARATITTAQERLDAHVAANPDLAKAGSDLIKAVTAELGSLRDLGYDPRDVRAQVVAVEKVLGKGAVVAKEVPNEYARRAIPVGGAGGGGGTDEPKKKPAASQGTTLWGQMTAESQQSFVQYRGSKEAAIKTLDHATDESVAAMRKAGRFK